MNTIFEICGEATNKSITCQNLVVLTTIGEWLNWTCKRNVVIEKQDVLERFVELLTKLGFDGPFEIKNQENYAVNILCKQGDLRLGFIRGWDGEVQVTATIDEWKIVFEVVFNEMQDFKILIRLIEYQSVEFYQMDNHLKFAKVFSDENELKMEIYYNEENFTGNDFVAPAVNKITQYLTNINNDKFVDIEKMVDEVAKLVEYDLLIISNGKTEMFETIRHGKVNYFQITETMNLKQQFEFVLNLTVYGLVTYPEPYGISNNEENDEQIVRITTVAPNREQAVKKHNVQKYKFQNLMKVINAMCDNT